MEFNAKPPEVQIESLLEALRSSEFKIVFLAVYGLRRFGELARKAVPELLRIFEEKSRLVKILNECVGPSIPQPVGVRIGAENSLPSLRGCAVITSYYGFGDQVMGSLGVVGPVRMEYARMISIVSYVARTLEKMMSRDISSN